MNAILAGACERIEYLGGEALGVRYGFAGLAEQRVERVTTLDVRSRRHEPGTWLGSSRWAGLSEEQGRRACREAAQAMGISGLLVIGGHGSALGARALADGLPVAFVPATIDRDVPGTAGTIGMDSAVNYAVDVIDRLRITGRSLPGRAFVVQTLGAPHGHLADAVAAAAGIDEVLVPERAYDLDAVAGRLRGLAASGSAVAVMSEAVGDAVRIAEALAERAQIRVHPTILGHAQRAAGPSAHDRALGRAAGHAAVDALAQRESAFITLTGTSAVAPAPLGLSGVARKASKTSVPSRGATR